MTWASNNPVGPLRGFQIQFVATAGSTHVWAETLKFCRQPPRTGGWVGRFLSHILSPPSCRTVSTIPLPARYPMNHAHTTTNPSDQTECPRVSGAEEAAVEGSVLVAADG